MTALIERLEHTYRGRGAARELMRRRDKEVLLSGPAGTGKSRACLEKINVAALKYPNMRGLIVRQVRDTLPATALETFEKFVIPEQLAAGSVAYRSGSGRRPARYQYSNGSELWIAGLDKPSKIMSTEFDMIYIQEATEVTPNGWESLVTRLRGQTMPYRQLIADCNPDSSTHWLNLRCNSGATAKIESRHRDNPVLADDNDEWTEFGREYMSTLDSLTGVRRLRLRDGIWAAAEGVCWPSFDPAVHVIPKFPIPKDWPRVWTVDFGLVHPFVWQAWAVDPDGRLFRYHEIHMTGQIVEDHAKAILQVVAPSGKWNQPKPQFILCDHDSEDRETLRRHLGMANQPANKAVKPGIEAVESRFAANRLFLMNGALVQRDQKLVNTRKPTVTEEEIGGYVWDANKEQPIKEDDDGCDAMRYAVSHFDLKSRGDVLRWLD